jgi:hypothetical protein
VASERPFHALRIKQPLAGRLGDQPAQLLPRLTWSELDEESHRGAHAEAVPEPDLIGRRRFADSVYAEWRPLRGVGGDDGQLGAAHRQLAQAVERRRGAVAEEGTRCHREQRRKQVSPGRHRRAGVGVDAAVRPPQLTGGEHPPDFPSRVADCVQLADANHAALLAHEPG